MTPNLVAQSLSANLADVRAHVAKAAEAAGRKSSDVTLIAVSKTHDAETVAAAIAAGQLVFGENRVQEGKAKFPLLKSAHPALELHLIGPLQTNKVRDAVALFDAIHTVDRIGLAEALSAELKRTGRTPTLFVQVNTGEEEQKAGVAPREALAFVEQCRTQYGLQIAGLMCIPPADEEPAMHFALLLKLARDAGLKELSMGMSGDYETAIRFGATHVRVGSAIFGARSAVTAA
ncbi:MAG: YggS family pyridoxal phosphate-dependent enzyme [Alphaproteobacteria bacterium]|nr:YggS family pyridoxal phosphate-dependent enzyme [Alphaproteobacteria bacterium]